MTQNEFVVECVQRTIEPSIALENEQIKEALLKRDDEKVKQLLDTEF